MTGRRKRSGFSLGEILVAVAIMAVVAAVVIPSIGGQLNKGDTARVSSDLISIRSGVEQFLADVRRYPSTMSHLQTKPLALTASDTGHHDRHDRVRQARARPRVGSEVVGRVDVRRAVRVLAHAAVPVRV